MARRPIPAVANDFDNVVEYLKTRGIIPASPPAGMLENAKKIHRATYSLILWRFRLKKLPHHRRVFIEEIASDALQILPQVLVGYGKTTKLLTRGVLENTLRHLYFSDHPIEYLKMNREHKWYMSVDELLNYVLDIPTFHKNEHGFDVANRTKGLYSDLSAGVHGRRMQDLEMRVALRAITYEEEAVKAEVAFIERSAEVANYMLAMFHRDKMKVFQGEDRRIILQTMCPKARQVWNGIV